MTPVLFLFAFLTADPALEAGDHLIKLTVDDRNRSYRLHIPEQYDPAVQTPVVVAFHGSAMNGKMMANFSGLSAKADQEGFIVVYPNGTGPRDPFLVFNAGEERFPSIERPNDVKFVAALLDDLATRVKVDAKRVYATGMSNGGMLCYKLAAELPGRFAAIAPVAGTMAIEMPAHPRPIPIIHFHGTADAIVTYEGPNDSTAETFKFKAVDETVRAWAAVDGCPARPQVFDMPDRSADDTSVRRYTYGPGKDGTEVVLYRIEGGGHTWPGSNTFFKGILGKSTHDIDANELIWEFFSRHALP